MVVDSSVWIEILTGGRLASKCESYIHGKKILVPATVIFEVYRKVKRSISDEAALEVVGSLSQYSPIDIDRDISLLAADLSIDHSIAMADAFVLACAVRNATQLLTLDNDFADIPNCVVLR